MARISKKKLVQPVFETIRSQLVASIVHARTKREAKILLEELLTGTERVMLAKRFAIIAMLVRNYSFEQIQELLQVSPDTVTRIWQDLKKGEYIHLAHYARNNPRKFEGESFLSLLEKFLEAGMAPRGRDRWKYFNSTVRKGSYYD